MNTTKSMNIIVLLIILIFTQITLAQEKAIKDDPSYYNSWVGKWYAVIDGKIAKQPRFVVSQGLNKTAYEEIWISEEYVSKAWRGWNSQDKKWDFAWVTDDGLFQIWEGRKVGGIWYMYKTFTINNEKILSRQAFILTGENALTRTSEHSKDDGKTWRLRFKEKYVKRQQ